MAQMKTDWQRTVLAFPVKRGYRLRRAVVRSVSPTRKAVLPDDSRRKNPPREIRGDTKMARVGIVYPK
jgi:hypothetical protein